MSALCDVVAYATPPPAASTTMANASMSPRGLRLPFMGWTSPPLEMRDDPIRDGCADSSHAQAKNVSSWLYGGAQQQRMISSLLPSFSSVCQAPAGMRIASPGRT